MTHLNLHPFILEINRRNLISLIIKINSNKIDLLNPQFDTRDDRRRFENYFELEFLLFFCEDELTGFFDYFAYLLAAVGALAEVLVGVFYAVIDVGLL